MSFGIYDQENNACMTVRGGFGPLQNVLCSGPEQDGTSMYDTLITSESKSTADVVFDQLHSDIVSLAILPGAKISEADIARRFGVSRQPVRDAFRRLHNLDLIEIRPQRATVVRRFSLAEIEHTRFVRLAVELEVMTRACEIWDQSHDDKLAKNLHEQSAALTAGEPAKFHELDYEFHRLICTAAGLPMAFETINLCKRKVARLCLLSLSNDENVAEILNDHLAISDALRRSATEDCRTLMREHTRRLSPTIAKIHETHADYFQ